MSKYHSDPRPQNVAYGRLELPPQIPTQRPCPPHPQQGSGFSQLSAAISQETLSLPASQFAAVEHLRDSAFLQLPSLRQYAGSEAVHRQHPISNHPETTHQLGHSVSHQGYGFGVNTTLSRGVGGLALDGFFPNHSGGNSSWRSMDGLSPQSAQGSSVDQANVTYGYPQAPRHRNEQSIVYQSGGSGALDPVGNFPGQDQIGVIGGSFGPDGMRASLRFCSVTDSHEAGGNLDPQPRVSATMGNNFGPGSELPLMGNQADTSPNPSFGIDPSLMNETYYEDCAVFGADADQTDGGEGGDLQHQRLPRTSEDLDSHSLADSSTSMVSRSDTVSETISRMTSGTAPRSRGRARTYARGRTRTRARSGAGHRTGQPVSSESSVTTCPTCDNDPDCERRPTYRGSADSQRSSIRRHIREEHSNGPIWTYQCSLDNDGSPCGAQISRADNRRRHVDDVHPTESKELPARDIATRNFNEITNARLNEWFSKVPR